jgi:hypothetical protein
VIVDFTRRFMRFMPMLAGAGFLLISSSLPSYAMDYEEYPVAKLRSLDKITARTMTFEVKVGSTVRFGEIFIKVQACRKPPPVEKPEAAAFLQVWQTNGQQADDNQANSKCIFSGWMFASSTALSGMEHPVYDVWVLDCLGRDPEPLPKATTAGVPTPPTDGAAPNAVPPAIQPDTAAKMKTDDVTKEDDPGAFDDETVPNTDAPKDPAITRSAPGTATVPPSPATASPASSSPAVTGSSYAPAQETPENYQDDKTQDDKTQDETPADDSSPKEDTIPTATPAPTENLEPKAEPADKQEIQGIY